jgi:type II secretory pathway component PulF
MKKIKSIDSLKEEQKRIKQEQQNIENRIRVNWQYLKKSMQPSSIAKEALQNIIEHKTASNNLKDTFIYAADLLSKKLAAKSVEKLKAALKK